MAHPQVNQHFNAQPRMNAAVQYLMNKKGYSPEDATALLSPYMAGWQQREDMENRQLADNIMNRLSSGDLSDAKYKQAIVQLANLGDYGRNAANVYGRDLVSGQDKWRAQQQAELEKQRFAQRQALAKEQYDYRLAIAKLAREGRLPVVPVYHPWRQHLVHLIPEPVV